MLVLLFAKKKKNREARMFTNLWNVTERGFVVRQSGVENLAEGWFLGLDPHKVEPFV